MTIGTALFTKELDAEGIPYELIEHARTETAHDEARALHLSETAVAKTIVLETEQGFVRAVLPASERLDLRKAKEALEVGEVRLASEATLAAAFPDFELGAVPPLSGPSDPLLVDRRVAASSETVLEAGSHQASVRLSPERLVAITHAAVADICQE